MLSIFRYPGGKSKIRHQILKYAPRTYAEYREPFVGGGGIYFEIGDGEQIFRIKRWINDKNDDLIAVYLALRDRPTEFIASCKSIEAMRDGEPEVYPTTNSAGKKYNKRLKEKFDELLSDKSVDPALRYFFVNRTVWGGRVNYNIPSRLYFSNPTGWNITKGKRLEEAAKFISGTRITCGDYLPLLETPGKDVWIYCDPPYMKDTNLSGPSKLYQMGFSLRDHVRFAKHVRNCKHNICISYDDHEYVHRLYDGLCISKLEWTYCGTSLDEKKTGRELIITNYNHHQIP